LSVDGVTKQSGDLADMIRSVAEQVSFLSGYFEIHPGDVIFRARPRASARSSAARRWSARSKASARSGSGWLDTALSQSPALPVGLNLIVLNTTEIDARLAW
jgi:hypothetical protein